MNNLKFLLLLSLSFLIVNTAKSQSTKITLNAGKYFIYVKSSEKVLDVIASSNDNSVELITYPFTGNPNQTFRVWVDANKSYCSFTPGGDYNTITGSIIYDLNEDGCDALDSPQPHIKVNINDGTEQGSTFTSTDGVYNFYTTSGSFDITPNMELHEL